MKLLIFRLLILYLGSLSPQAEAAPPALVRVGVQTIHRSSTTILTNFIPLPEDSSKIFDSNHRDFDRPLPLRFILSDGTLKRTFLGVDQTPGSTLARHLDRLLEKARRFGPSTTSQDRILKFIQTKFNDELGMVEETSPLPFDRGLSANTPFELQALFIQARDLPLMHTPLRSRVLQRVTPLEDYIAYGKSYCLQKAILASLLLSRVGIDHRFIAGSTGTAGHSWIILKDGRVLDPTWQVLELPTTQGAFAGWYHYSNTFVYEYHTFPITEI